MLTVLESPRAVDDLYLARSVEVSFFRPVMTGDIFKDIDIPGVDDSEVGGDHLAMIVSHPCSMRNGPNVREAVQVVRVRRWPPVPLLDWKRHFDVMPLPSLFHVNELEDPTENAEDDSYAAFLDLRGRVRGVEVTLDRRIACLSEEGVGFLHQRMSNHDSRHAPRVNDFVDACAPPLRECELAEEWNSRLLKLDGLEPTERDTALRQAAIDLDEVLSEQRLTPPDGTKKPVKYRLRDDLEIPKKAPAVRREVLKIIKQRQLVA